MQQLANQPEANHNSHPVARTGVGQVVLQPSPAISLEIGEVAVAVIYHAPLRAGYGV